MEKIKIKDIRNDIAEALKEIQNARVLPFFEQLDFRSTLNDRSKNIKTVKITDIASLDEVPSQAGFYIIFSDIKYQENDCRAIFNDEPVEPDEPTIKAIYRGEANKVRVRLKSHLFNECYKEYFEESEKESNFYSTTLTIDGSKVNLDKKQYNQYEWYVVYIAAPKSNRNVRNMYEDSFDQFIWKTTV